MTKSGGDCKSKPTCRLADADPVRNGVRAPALWDNGKMLAKLAREVDVATLGPSLLAALGDRLRVTGQDVAVHSAHSVTRRERLGQAAESEV